MLELRGRSGAISQLAFSRGSPSRAKFDKRSHVDLGNRDAHDAAVQDSDACFVNAAILQPTCRTT
eukprot:5405304-Pyramimonas_sp.AAC.1